MSWDTKRIKSKSHPSVSVSMDSRVGGTCFISMVRLLMLLACPHSGITMTTEATESERNVRVPDDIPSFARNMPQSALSLVGLGMFVIISIVIAAGMEKLYERLSLRDDSSDMSEGTKNILRAKVLNMVFGVQKVPFESLKGKARESAIAKKYWDRWQYNMVMRKQKRKRESLHEERTKVGVFGSLRRKFSRLFSRSKMPSLPDEPQKEDLEAKPTTKNTTKQAEVNIVNEYKKDSNTKKSTKTETNTNGNTKASSTNKEQTTSSGASLKSPQSSKVLPAVKQSPRQTQIARIKNTANPSEGKPKHRAADIPKANTPKSDFVAVDLKLASMEHSEDDDQSFEHGTEENVTQSTLVLMPSTENLADSQTTRDDTLQGALAIADPNLSVHNEEDDEFEIIPTHRSNMSVSSVNKQRVQSKNESIGQESETASHKDVRAETPKTGSLVQKLKNIRPLTAGKSRQIAPGGANRTDNSESYKKQGNSVRLEVLQRLGTMIAQPESKK